MIPSNTCRPGSITTPYLPQHNLTKMLNSSIVLLGLLALVVTPVATLAQYGSADECACEGQEVGYGGIVDVQNSSKEYAFESGNALIDFVIPELTEQLLMVVNPGDANIILRWTVLVATAWCDHTTCMLLLCLTFTPS